MSLKSIESAFAAMKVDIIEGLWKSEEKEVMERTLNSARENLETKSL